MVPIQLSSLILWTQVRPNLAKALIKTEHNQIMRLTNYYSTHCQCNYSTHFQWEQSLELKELHLKFLNKLRKILVSSWEPKPGHIGFTNWVFFNTHVDYFNYFWRRAEFLLNWWGQVGDQFDYYVVPYMRVSCKILSPHLYMGLWFNSQCLRQIYNAKTFC